MAASELVTEISIRTGNVTYHTLVDYCRHCHHEWKGKRRLTGHGLKAVCELCRNREQEGLVRYRPSNGTEWMMFADRCDHCRFNRDDHESPPDHAKGTLCAWGIKDKLVAAMWEPDDSNVLWHAPEDVRATAEDGRPMCPAKCLRFVHGDNDDDSHDPPPTPDPNQMTFDDVLEVKEREVVHVHQ